MRSISQCSSCDCMKFASGTLETKLCESIAIISHSKSTTVCIRYASPRWPISRDLVAARFLLQEEIIVFTWKKEVSAALCSENSIRRTDEPQCGDYSDYRACLGRACRTHSLRPAHRPRAEPCWGGAGVSLAVIFFPM